MNSDNDFEREIAAAIQRNNEMKQYDIIGMDASINGDKLTIILENGMELTAPLDLVDIGLEYGDVVEIGGLGDCLYFHKNDEYMSLTGLVLHILSKIPGCIVSHKNRSS